MGQSAPAGGRLPLLAVRDLAVTYRGQQDEVAAVRGVTFDVLAGEVVAIVGESGSGKSTTAHAVVGLLPPTAQITSGEVMFDGRSITHLQSRARRAMLGTEIALVAQDPAVALDPVKRIGSQVVEVLKVHRICSGKAAQERAVELLTMLGLPDPGAVVRQYPHELSGGMQQRVLIAIALAAGPKLVVADEPTSALDVTVQRRILDRLETLTRETGTALLMITHDLAVASDRADRIVVMADGLVVESGPSRGLLASPRDAYTQRLVASDPRLKVTPRRTSAASSTDDSADGRAMLVEVSGLVKTFPLRGHGGENVRRAVAGVSISLRRGETLALVGESGSGKSTLGRLILGLTSPSEGTVAFDGIDLAQTGAKEMRHLRRRMQVVYQSPFSSLDPRYSVERIIEEPLRVHKVGDSSSRAERVRYLLEHVALPPNLMRRKPRELSGGQCQRVAIARALALDPDLLVCDEPVSALDVTVQDQIISLLARLQTEFGLTMLFISHDLSVVRQVADRVAVMRAGVIVEFARAEDIFANARHPYTSELLAAMPGQRHAAG